MATVIEKIAIVQCYIKLRTDKDVDIQVPTSLRHLMLLDRAYNIALKEVKSAELI